MYLVAKVNCQDDFFPAPDLAVINLCDQNLHYISVLAQITHEGLCKLKDENLSNGPEIEVRRWFPFKMVPYAGASDLLGNSEFVLVKDEDMPADLMEVAEEDEALVGHKLTCILSPTDMACQFVFCATVNYSGQLLETAILDHIDLVEGALDHGIEL